MPPAVVQPTARSVRLRRRSVGGITRRGWRRGQRSPPDLMLGDAWFQKPRFAAQFSVLRERLGGRPASLPRRCPSPTSSATSST